MTTELYTANLQAGLGAIAETWSLFELWTPGMSPSALNTAALGSGRFPNMSARRLRNFVIECFGPRFLRNDGVTAAQLKALSTVLSKRELDQLLFIATCRANAILADFVREVYWTAYTAGRERLSNAEAREFVVRANQDGKTTRTWSDSTVRRVASYLVGCCSDFGLLDRGSRSERKILPYRIESRAVVVLAYQLHYAGAGDNLLVGDSAWSLFGMDRADVVNELKRLSLQGYFLVQSAGGVTRIEWRFEDWEELIRVFAQR